MICVWFFYKIGDFVIHKTMNISGKIMNYDDTHNSQTTVKYYHGMIVSISTCRDNGDE